MVLLLSCFLFCFCFLTVFYICFLSASGLLANQTLLLLITMTTLVSPFLYLDRGHRPDFVSHQERAHKPRGGLASSPLYSRQATLMMASTSPRIGVRSSLIGSSDTCHVDPVRMSIRPPRKYAHLCAPTTEISFGCRGGCSSYSRVNVRNTTNVLRSCR